MTTDYALKKIKRARQRLRSSRPDNLVMAGFEMGLLVGELIDPTSRLSSREVGRLTHLAYRVLDRSLEASNAL